MSDRTLSEDAAQQVFEDQIVPVFFPDQPDGDTPRMTLVVGQPGAAAIRVARQLSGPAAAVLSATDLRAFHPRFLELSRTFSPEAARILQDSASGWLRNALQHARNTKRSILLDGTLSSHDVALATTSLFGTSGFETAVAAVAVPQPESLLASASKYLLDARAGRAAQFTTLAAHDEGLRNTRALVDTLETTPSVDHLTIIGRDGVVLFDTSRADPSGFAGALAEFDRAHATAPSAASAMRWLSELRAATDYALSLRQVPAPLAEVLIELHEIGRHEVLPRLQLPQASQARPNADAALERRLTALRQATQVVNRPDRRPGPSVSTPDLDRGISI
ncbi:MULTISPECIES: zeta toxin family protein [Microbacterium]|uniref:UDP-N-acetylglucosamine kinase n=1 Tax=Microbacterium wangchenii TaxID=2541726 RepID=A0ABX5SV83_9MICO|nr:MULTISPECIES: zeta toxin family protein [Microbacterium]MCK6065774.1 zeta toxin family protein [Microbacterium sp. EYE_512]QBR90090.1 hypothetical protein E4K62_16210 [Microbacterium wangchenii]